MMDIITGKGPPPARGQQQGKGTLSTLQLRLVVPQELQEFELGHGTVAVDVTCREKLVDCVLLHVRIGHSHILKAEHRQVTSVQ